MYALKILWEPSATLFKIGGFGIHYYSLMFVIAFSLGFNIMKKMYEKEKVSIETLESMLFYIVIATLLGARLGHVFFYDWAYYQDHLMEILLPISSKAGGGYAFVGFRGLASHGAAIGILLGIILYQRNYPYKPLAWILDRLIIPTTLGGAFVRIGNFLTQKSLGISPETNLEWSLSIEENRYHGTPPNSMKLLHILSFTSFCAICIAKV